MSFHGISATDKDDPNAEYFFGCSGGEFEKVKELIEADPSLGKKKLIAHNGHRPPFDWAFCFLLRNQ